MSVINNPSGDKSQSTDFVDWHETELKVRDLHSKEASDCRRLGAEFSKLIITNLLWINSAGLGSLPITAKFIGIDAAPWSQKLPILIWPAAAFAAGLFLASICALCAYFNFEALGAAANSACGIELGNLRKLHPTYLANPQNKVMVDGALQQSQTRHANLNWWVQFYLWSSIGAGVASAVLFAFGVYKLISVSPP